MRSMIAVAGATGHTGKFVVNELRRRGQDVIALTRSGQQMGDDAGVEFRAFDIGDEANLAAALHGADALINCAGPFFDTALPLARAAVQCGIFYLDVTAEQPTITALATSLDSTARNAGVIVAPGMAFYGALADLMATALIGPDGAADKVDIAVALDSWHPTEGTRRTGERNTAPRLVIRGGHLTPLETGKPDAVWEYPEPFGTLSVREVPLAEMILIDRHLRVGSATSFMNLAPLNDLHDASTPPPLPSDSVGRSSQQFLMHVRAQTAGATRHAIARGQDIYAITAPIVVSACLTLLANGAGRSVSGVCAPGEFLDARAFLDGLAPDLMMEWREI